MEAQATLTPGTGAVGPASPVIPPVKQIADGVSAGPRKRGRPPKNRPAESVGGGPAGGLEAGQTDAAAVAPQVDVALVKKTVESVIGAIDGAIIRKVYATHLRISKDEGAAKELATTAGITKDEMAVIAECTGVVCQKYNILGQYAPEAMLLAVGVGYGLRVTFVFRKLNVLIELQAAQLRKLHAAKSPANQNPNNG